MLHLGVIYLKSLGQLVVLMLKDLLWKILNFDFERRSVILV